MIVFKNIIYTLFLLTLIISCTKEQPQLLENESADLCPEMYEVNSSLISDTVIKGDYTPNQPAQPNYFYTSDYYYFDLAVNPNNPFEFVFKRCEVINQQPSFEDCKLYKFNFCNSNLNFIDDVDYSCTIDWGSNNWIIYASNFDVYKIRPNTSDKTQIINSANGIHALHWSPNETKILASIDVNAVKIFNQNGDLLETLSFNYNSICWKNNTEAFYSYNGAIYVYDIENLESTLYLTDNFQGANDLMTKSDKLLFSSNQGIYEIDTSNNNALLIDSNHTTYFGRHPIGLENNKMLLSRKIIDTNEFFMNNVNTRSYLTFFDKQTSEERIINIPE